ncbi:[citrate (pro-3S)-lyase] ligase [Spiroplasma helicoides]|uniref:[citrate (Pro-3S)-lyase] ligase n=1 Tax=Spiroplasma helicoides TaxID=216938 RepID=A0A1B3SM25_9MOLU|nr:hypothetical protein [Spiroplasma helicoides]AOG60989.1 [citrate (pro-3S)-lyase] ligase [Spiroplasma helicoides]
MNNFKMYYIDLNSSFETKRVTEFLKRFDLEYNLVDATLVIKDEKQKIIATCSKLNNVIKCIAVCKDYINQNFLNKLVTEISKLIYLEKQDEIFVFTKPENKFIFEGVGFDNIFVNDKIAFLTNKINNYKKYKTYIQNLLTGNDIAILLMNCNPLTKGHGFLIEYASKKYQQVYIIPVKEDVSLFTYEERKQMLSLFVKNFTNVALLKGSDYLISKATFPTYFLNEEDKIVIANSEVDANVFVNLFENTKSKITRVVGSEPNSRTTNLYNNVMNTVLEKNNIGFEQVERYTINNNVVSASTVRKNIYENKEWESLVPQTTIEIIKKVDIKKRMTEKNVYKNN